jgi:hypothetical protein
MSRLHYCTKYSPTFIKCYSPLKLLCYPLPPLAAPQLRKGKIVLLLSFESSGDESEAN